MLCLLFLPLSLSFSLSQGVDILGVPCRITPSSLDHNRGVRALTETLFRVLGLLSLSLWCVCVWHLGVLAVGALGSLLGLSLLAGLFLGRLLGCPLGIHLGLYRLALGLDLLEMSLDDGAGQGADLVNLGDVDSLGGVLTILVQPVLNESQSTVAMAYMGSRVYISETHLGSLQLGLDLLLLLVAGKVGVLLVELVAELVDERLELVLLLLGIGD